MPKIQEFIKRNLLFFIKIVVLLFGLGFILKKISESVNTVSFSTLNISAVEILNIIIVLTVFSFLNWYGELKKWKGLAQTTTTSETARQVFISHGLAIFTPNKFGEYGGKCMFYPKHKSHHIIGLTGIGHFCQLGATLVFGSIGLASLSGVSFIEFTPSTLWISILTLMGLAVLFSLKTVQDHLKGILKNLKNLKRKIVSETMLWSMFRYLIFSHQFLILFWCFDVHLNYVDGLAIIFTIYLLASIIPSFALSDVLVKGSIAVTLFSMLDVKSNLVLTIVFLMWVFNTMLPALAGYWMLLQWKPKFHVLQK